MSPFLLPALLTFPDPHLAWLALEYCPGGDLHEFLKVYERFEEQEVTLYFAEMIMGVHDLHKMGYLHRDLKPANFLIDKTGHIKLADFGLAKHIHAVGKSRTSGESDDSADGEKASGTISQEQIEKKEKRILENENERGQDHGIRLLELAQPLYDQQTQQTDETSLYRTFSYCLHT